MPELCRCAGPMHNCWRFRLPQWPKLVMPEPLPAWASYEAMLRRLNDLCAEMILTLPSPPALKPAPLGGPGPFWAAVKAIDDKEAKEVRNG